MKVAAKVQQVSTPEEILDELYAFKIILYNCGGVESEFMKEQREVLESKLHRFIGGIH